MADDLFKSARLSGMSPKRLRAEIGTVRDFLVRHAKEYGDEKHYKLGVLCTLIDTLGESIEILLDRVESLEKVSADRVPKAVTKLGRPKKTGKSSNTPAQHRSVE